MTSHISREEKLLSFRIICWALAPPEPAHLHGHILAALGAGNVHFVRKHLQHMTTFRAPAFNGGYISPFYRAPLQGSVLCFFHGFPSLSLIFLYVLAHLCIYRRTSVVSALPHLTEQKVLEIPAGSMPERPTNCKG